MKERVAELVGPVAHRMWVSTFHSACARILRREAALLGYRSSFSIYDQADATRLVDYVRRDMNLDPKRFPPRRLQGSISAMKNELIGPEQALADATTPPEKRLAEIYVEYQKRLRRGVRGRLRRPAPARREAVPRAPRRARPLAAALQPRPRRRVPGHEPRPVGARAPPRRAAPQRHGRRRRRPVLRRRHAGHDGRPARRGRSSRSSPGDEVLLVLRQRRLPPAHVSARAPRAGRRRARRSRSRAAASSSPPRSTRTSPARSPARACARRSRRPSPTPTRTRTVATLTQTRRMVVTLCDEQRGARAFHRVELFGSDEEGRTILEEELGLLIRPERRDTDWRFETASADMAEIVAIVERIRAVLDVDVEYTARLAARQGGPRDEHGPAVHARVGGRARHGDGQRERRVRAGRDASSRSSIDSRGLRPRHRAARTTTSPAASSPTTASTRSAARTTGTCCGSRRSFPDASVIVLDQNYRSTQRILDAANAVIANNAARRPKHLWTEQIGGELIVRYHAEDEHDEAQFVVHEINRLADQEGVRFRDTAVFYRTNAQSRVDRRDARARRRAVPDHRRHEVLRPPRGEGRARVPRARS